MAFPPRPIDLPPDVPWPFDEPVTAQPYTSADERLDAARAALGTLDTLTTPVLPIDVLEILTDLRTALEP